MEEGTQKRARAKGLRGIWGGGDSYFQKGWGKVRTARAGSTTMECRYYGDKKKGQRKGGQNLLSQLVGGRRNELPARTEKLRETDYIEGIGSKSSGVKLKRGYLKTREL